MSFWNFLAFSTIQWMLAIWSLVLLPLKNPAYTSGSSWFTYCWRLAWRILSITLCELPWWLRVKRSHAMQKTQVWSLGQEDPLEKEMATHSSILAWRIQWMEEPGRLQSTGSQRVRHNWATSHALLACEMSKTVWQFEQFLALPAFGIGMKTDFF